MNRKERNDGKNICPHCDKEFPRLHRHEPYCESNPHRKENLVSCPYCNQMFQGIDMHKPFCKSKPGYEENLKDNEKQLSTDKRESKVAQERCLFCQEKFKCLNIHIRHCPLKPDDDEDVENNKKQLSTDDSDDSDDRKKSCAYCRKRFQRLDKHTPFCKSKRGCKIPQERCPFCQGKFERLNIHIRHCPSKPDDDEDVENNKKQLSTDDSDEDLCQSFQRFDIQKSDYLSKRDGEEDLKNNEKKLSADDSDDEDNKKRLRRRDDEQEENLVPCQYCYKGFPRVHIHEARCPSQPPGERNFNGFLKTVTLKMVIDMKNFNDKMNDVKIKLNDKIDKRDVLRWDVLNTGSYYSRVKVSHPDEFDYMFCPTRVQCRIEPNSDHPCHCKVFITNKEELPDYFTGILESSGEIIPSKYKDFCFKVFDSIVEQKQSFERITNESSSAYTVEYKYKFSKNTTKIDVDWVPCLKVQNVDESFKEWKTRKLTEEEKEDRDIYVVAKEPSVDDKLYDLWRLSFSVFEKKIIREKCKRDDHQLIRIIKKILEEVKNDDTKICSYHIVTHCLHSFEEIKKRPKLKEYTIDVINLLIDRLDQRFLPHFFIPKFNLLKEVSEAECQKFIGKLKYYINQWTIE